MQRYTKSAGTQVPSRWSLAFCCRRPRLDVTKQRVDRNYSTSSSFQSHSLLHILPPLSSSAVFWRRSGTPKRETIKGSDTDNRNTIAILVGQLLIAFPEQYIFWKEAWVRLMRNIRVWNLQRRSNQSTGTSRWKTIVHPNSLHHILASVVIYRRCFTSINMAPILTRHNVVFSWALHKNELSKAGLTS